MAINDVTYLLDESLQLLKKIHDIETDIDNKEEWDATPMVEIIIKKVFPIDFIFL
jgi:ubiquitin conjugation factor E4 B